MGTQDPVIAPTATASQDEQFRSFIILQPHTGNQS